MTTQQAPPNGRQLPQDLEAEAALLGAILLEPEAIGLVIDILEPSDFYRQSNGHIYAAAAALFREGKPVEYIGVAAEMRRAKTLDAAGGSAHLAYLREQAVTVAVADHLARIVKGKAQRRRVIQAGQQSVALGYDDTVAPEDAVATAQANHYGLEGQQAGTGPVAVGDLLKPVFDRLEIQASGSAAGTVGLMTGFADLDRMTNGFKQGDLVIIAGRPSMGKTAAVIQIAMHAALELRVPVAMFSLEMSKESVVERMLCTQAQVDSQRLQRGVVGEAEFNRLSSALGPLGDAPIWIDDTGSLDDLTLRLRSRQAKSRYGIGLIVVDYLQLMHSRSRNGDANRVQEVSAISRSLKGIARDLGVVVIALSQLSRAPEGRPDKRPILSDLRESGSIEQDSDVVLAMFRDDYYSREKSEKPGIAEVLILKHRNGPTGVVELFFRKECTRFESIDRRAKRGGGGDD